MSDLTLCFAKSIGVDIDGNNVYELLLQKNQTPFGAKVLNICQPHW